MLGTADAFGLLQGAFALRCYGRMLGGAAGDPIPVKTLVPPGTGRASAIVPVLDERARLGPCLAGLSAQPEALERIIVVDGGSTDGTRELVRNFAAREPRIVLVDAAPVPATWNGKAWGLRCGLAATDAASDWILTIDADVRPAETLVTSLLAFAADAHLDAFSAAPRFTVGDAGQGLLHPALLATLVYRRGLPGGVARTPADVQANGQCFLARRAALVETSAFDAARTSRCDDVTIARTLVAAGKAVGFFEGDGLATVEMYDSLRGCWRNWPRSLGLADPFVSRAGLALALAEVALVQALPLAIVATLALRGRTDSKLFALNRALLIARFAVLMGMRRAYATVPATYWLAPLADLPALGAIVAALLDDAPTWRGRPLVREQVSA